MQKLYLKIKLLVPLFQALNKIEAEWKSVSFSVVLYKNTNTYILKSTDDISQLLDDHIVLVQSMSFSPFKKPFEERMNLWETKLKITQVLVFTHTHVGDRQLGCCCHGWMWTLCSCCWELGGQLSREDQSLGKNRACESPLTLGK